MIGTWRLYLTASILFCCGVHVPQGLAEGDSERVSAWQPSLYKPAQPAKTCGARCGTYRSSIKTLSDREAANIDFVHPESRTVDYLVSQPRPTKIPTGSRTPIEKRSFEVTAQLVSYKLEQDKDFYVVVRDVKNYKAVMVVRIPSTECSGACEPKHRDDFNKARAAIVKLIGPTSVGKYRTPDRPTTVQLKGVAFVDVKPKEAGLPVNGIELILYSII